jgi:hypothetical protein
VIGRMVIPILVYVLEDSQTYLIVEKALRNRTFLKPEEQTPRRGTIGFKTIGLSTLIKFVDDTPVIVQIVNYHTSRI